MKQSDAILKWEICKCIKLKTWRVDSQFNMAGLISLINKQNNFK